MTLVQKYALLPDEIDRESLKMVEASLPDSLETARDKLQTWADFISSGKADSFKESNLLPKFLLEVFGELLGYTDPSAASDRYTLLQQTNASFLRSNRPD